jgi:uncharacterized protein YrrD
MLRSVKSLEGNTLGATDGTIGKLKDFYFDDEAWVIRYAVVDTSTWLGGRKVLVSPYAIREPSTVVGTLPVSVTREQIRNSPSIDTDKPISRQYEKTYLGYYDYPYYWGGFGLWGDYNYPGTLSDGLIESRYRGYLHSPSAEDSGSDPHLRSCNAVKGYHILASDGEIGHVQGFVLDDHSWAIRYLVVNTSNWWIGHEVLVSPEWIQDVSWSESTVTVDLSRKSIKDAPVYDGNAMLDREVEVGLYRHYGRDGYWHNDGVRAEVA